MLWYISWYDGFRAGVIVNTIGYIVWTKLIMYDITLTIIMYIAYYIHKFEWRSIEFGATVIAVLRDWWHGHVRSDLILYYYYDIQGDSVRMLATTFPSK